MGRANMSMKEWREVVERERRKSPVVGNCEICGSAIRAVDEYIEAGELMFCSDKCLIEYEGGVYQEEPEDWTS